MLNNIVKNDESFLINIGSTVKFVVIGTGRCGSTLLCDSLNNHPAITCFGEIYHHLHFPNEISSFLGYSISERNLKPKNFLNTFWETYQEKSCIGFKIGWDQADVIGDEIINALYLKKIVIYRENLLKQFVSQKMAELTQIWALNLGQSQKNVKIIIDLAEFFSYVANVNYTYKNWYNLLNTQEYIIVKYEDLIADKDSVFNKICSFLNQPFCKLESTLKKQLSENLEDLIENYDEVENTLKNTEYEKFLD